MYVSGNGSEYVLALTTGKNEGYVHIGTITGKSPCLLHTQETFFLHSHLGLLFLATCPQERWQAQGCSVCIEMGMLAAKPEDLNSVPGTPVKEEKSQVPQGVPLTHSYVHSM